MSGAHDNIGAVENNNSSSPKHFMVLDAVSRGIDDIDKIAKVTKFDKAEVELAVNDLAAQRLVLAHAKKRTLFGRRGLQVSMTETGGRLLQEKKRHLEKKANELQNSYRNGNRQATQSFMDENRAWLPMMIFSGLMSAVMFASIMSFAGMAMNPAESAAMAGNSNDDAAANLQETSTDSGAGESSSSYEDTSGGNDAGFDVGGGEDLGGSMEF